MLPVKSTSVVADGCLSSWTARFNQAKRHAQGVAEFSYVLLGVFNLLRTLPRSAYSWVLARKLCRLVLLPFSINMLPICQTFPLAAVSILWFLNGRELPQCPSSLWLQLSNPLFYTCVFAGGFNIGVNIMIPLVLVILANSYMIDACFVQPGLSGSLIWYREDGDLPATLGSKRLTAFGLVAADILLLLPAIMPIYGLIPAILAYWNCFVRGNRFDFISAAKVANATPHREGSSPRIGPLRSPAGNSAKLGIRPLELPQVVLGRAEEDDAVRLRQISKSFGKTPKSAKSEGPFELQEECV